MQRRLMIALALVAVVVPTAAAGRPGPPIKLPAPPAGSLMQLGGPTGCITTSGGACSQSPLLKGAWDVKVSPDGLNVYVASRYSDAVLVYARDPHTGGLLPLPGTAACVSKSGSGGFCTQGRDLYQPVSLAFSGSGQFLLVASRLSNGVAVFQRDLSPGPLHGQLTQPAGKAGCINTSGAQGCASPTYTVTDRARAVVAVGSFVYVAVPYGVVAVFAQVQATGELEQLPLPDGCISTNGGSDGRCTKAPPMPAPVALAVAGSHLVIGSLGHYGGNDGLSGSYVSTVVEVPLDHGAALSDPTGPCYTAAPTVTVNGGSPIQPAAGCTELSGALGDATLIATGPRGDVFAIGSMQWPFSQDLALFQQSAGSFVYDNCVGGYDVCGDNEAGADVAAFSADEQRLYTSAAVYCRNPTDPLGAGYVLCGPTRVGRPTKPNGDTNVIPTAMTTSPDGSSVYLTFGTPSGYPTKLGGIYVLHVVG